MSFLDEVSDERCCPKEFVEPYFLFEMAIGSGLTHEQAVKEVREYCVKVGLDPYSI